MQEIAQQLAEANSAGQSVCIQGGGTKQDWGNPGAPADVTLSTAYLNRVIEHAWADMTVTVEAGCTVAKLQATLAEHGQRLAIDPLWPERATIGGILATNDSGVLRLRYGSLRDLIIGITVVLADGTIAKSGGKVVKNVAGYDLPKLMTGSLGTLGVITEAVFRLHPLPHETLTYTITCADREDAQLRLLAIQDSQLAHSALQLQGNELDILFEGTAAGIAAQVKTLGDAREVSQDVWKARERLWPAECIVKFSVLPSQIAKLAPQDSVTQATGVGYARVDDPLALRGVIEAAGGSVQILTPSPHDAFGKVNALPLMRAVKQQFDPNQILKPGPVRGRHLMAETFPVFDAHHPPAPELINQCVHCGFCLPACPTYVLWGQEMDSPRGRIYLIKMASEGTSTMTPQWVEHIDKCLGCMSCMTACPSGVDYSKLIEATRAQVERNYPRSFGERLHRKLIFKLFPNVRLLRAMRPFLKLYQSTGLQSIVSGLLPKRLATMDKLLPKIGDYHEVAVITPAVRTKRARVGLMLGCVQREFLSEVNAATARVLAAEGCEVVAPVEQGCCGALLVHAGEEAPALELARKMIETFERAEVDVVITNAGGCGSNVRDYGHLLRDDPQYADRAKAFSAKCRDITEYMCELGARAVRHPLKLRVAYHDSCHLQHAQRVRTQPRELLSAIPGLQLLEIPEGAICCGSAGIYNMVQPETAQTLGDRKAELIAPLTPDAVATGNPGCLLQLQSALARKGKPVRIFHTVQILDASISGKEL